MATPVRAVARQRLSDQVTQHLHEMIVEGEVAAGETLPAEKELARQFGVSTTVIREALNRLHVHGLVEIRHGVGSFVTTPDRWHMVEPIATLIRSGRATLFHVLEVRATIEVLVSGLAAERGDPALVRTLDDALHRMADSIEDPIANVEADMEFHQALAAGAGNPVLPLVLQPILAPIHTSMLRGTRLPAAMARAIEEHAAIRDAVAAQDPEAARAAMQIHMGTYRSEIVGAPLAPKIGSGMRKRRDPEVGGRGSS